MILFKHARSFLQASDHTPIAKKKLLDWLQRFQGGEFIIHPASLTADHCFQSTELQLDEIFFVRIWQDAKGMFEESVFMSFIHPHQTRHLADTIRSFERFKHEHLNGQSGEELYRRVFADRADLTTVYMVCRDHEGFMGLLVVQKEMSSDLGILLLDYGFKSRCPDRFPGPPAES